MSVRIATAEDIPAMHRIRLSVRENALSDPSKVRSDDYRPFLAVKGCGWVYETDGEIVGFAIADSVERNIWALFVDPGFERRGIGRALHDTMLRWLFLEDRRPVWLGTRPGSRAESFYRMAGWQWVGTRPNGELRFERRFSDIQTERLVLRLATVDDVDAIAQAAEASSTSRISTAVANQARHWHDHGYGLWVLLPRGKENLIGWCGLKPGSDASQPELMFGLQAASRHSGFASEAVSAVVAFALSDPRVSTVWRATSTGRVIDGRNLW
jgi:RimJ/RimL family protein N-acetyltransferase